MFQACARGVGMMAKVHLNLVLTRLDQVTHTELSRRPSRLLGLMKDPRVDFEVCVNDLITLRLQHNANS